MRPSDSIEDTNSSPRPDLRASMKKQTKGSWLSRSRPRLGKQRSLTSSIRLKKGNANDEAREEAEETQLRGSDHDEQRNPPASPIVLQDDLEEDEESSYTNINSGIYNDRSLHSLSPFETDFIDNTIAKLHTLGYGNQGGVVDLYSLGMLLREICALAKPFDSSYLQSTTSEDELHGLRRRPKVNIDPLWKSLEPCLEHALPIGGASRSCGENNVLDSSRSMTTKQMKRLICTVLREMNVKVTKGGSDRGGGRRGGTQNNGSWVNPPFMNSWNSLSYCHCSLF